MHHNTCFHMPTLLKLLVSSIHTSSNQQQIIHITCIYMFCSIASYNYDIKADSRMSGILHLSGDLDMLMSIAPCFTCHNNISLRCSFSFLIRYLSWYEVAVTSVEKLGCLKCALQSDSFTEINKYPERKSDCKPVVCFVKAARSKRETKSNHTSNQTELWRCHLATELCVIFVKTYIVMYSFTATTSSTLSFERMSTDSLSFFLLIYQCHRAVCGIMGNWVSTQPPSAYLCST